jgi:hypothetical protein
VLNFPGRFDWRGGVRRRADELLLNSEMGIGAGDGLRTRCLNLGKVGLSPVGPLRSSSNSIGAVLCQGRCCGAQPHSIVFAYFCQPPKSFTPVNSCSRRLPLLELTERLIQWNEVAAASRLVDTKDALTTRRLRARSEGCSYFALKNS